MGRLAREIGTGRRVRGDGLEGRFSTPVLFFFGVGAASLVSTRRGIRVTRVTTTVGRCGLGTGIVNTTSDRANSGRRGEGLDVGETGCVTGLLVSTKMRGRQLHKVDRNNVGVCGPCATGHRAYIVLSGCRTPSSGRWGVDILEGGAGPED